MSTDLVEYEFKSEPFGHQADEWKHSRDLRVRAIFWEQGTGKTKLTIDTACFLYEQGKIDCLWIIAPNGVHRNWVETEFLEHVPDRIAGDVRAVIYDAEKGDTKWLQKALDAAVKHKGFTWIAMGYGAVNTKRGAALADRIMNERKSLLVLDESQYIKSFDVKLTKTLLHWGSYPEFKRILTGTPGSTGPFDYYSQLLFLDQAFWHRHGFSSYYGFKSYFGVTEKVWNQHVIRSVKNPKTGKYEKKIGAEVDVVVGYKNLERLNGMLKGIATRVKKEDVLDLPQKLYSKRFFKLSREQSQLYEQMKNDFIVWLQTEAVELLPAGEVLTAGACPTCKGAGEIEADGFVYQCPDCTELDQAGSIEGFTPVIAEMALTRLLRLQQITCGYLPVQNEGEAPCLQPLPGKNARLSLILDEIESRGHKTIVWARFVEDISLIQAGLQNRGISCVRYDGTVSQSDRAQAKYRFQGERPIWDGNSVVGKEAVPEDEQAQVFIGNPAAGATGLTLHAAKTVFYYSNSFKLIDRLQSEDRAHRIGLRHPVEYIDIVAEGTVDEGIIKALRGHFSIACQILGDGWREFL